MRSLHVLRAGAAAVMIGALGVPAAGAAVQSRPVTTTAARTCPAGILRLTADGVPRAATRALAEASRLYPGINTRGAEVMAADRSAFAGARGREVKFLCGSKVAARTVVVQMLFPKMLPSGSLSQGVLFAGRFAHGYRVWYVAH